jgi:hypothetical protein
MSIRELLAELHQLTPEDKRLVIDVLQNDLAAEISRPDSPGNYQDARGVLRWSFGDEPAELTIRRHRDADWD